MTTTVPSYVIFSGGSACNYIAKAFHEVGLQNVVYILGISDNGGSTSEILRVLGGPSIGDLRSRLTRLIDIADTCPSDERVAIKELVSYRLSCDPERVKDEWASIVEGRHRLWKRIPAEKKETIRGFLTNFNGEILKRAHRRFNFCNGSIGNFLLTGARLFFGSLEAALFLFSAITTSGGASGDVLPVINTNHSATIAAQLQNGDTILGQCEISHPSTSGRTVTMASPSLMVNPVDAFMQFGSDDYKTQQTTFDDLDDLDGESDISSSDSSSNLFYSKHDDEHQPLTSPIQRVYYINDYGQEIYPVPNAKVITQLSVKNTLVYSIGSLYTSIIPCLILRHMGNAIVQSRSLKHKVLLLNGCNDRETHGYSALDFVLTITAALNQSLLIDCRRTFYQQNQPLSTATMLDTDSGYVSSSTPPPPPFPDHLFQPSPPDSFITHLIYLDQGDIPVDVEAIERLGIQCIKTKGDWCSSSGKPIYNDDLLTGVLRSL